jgi:hypothetical protein
MEPRAAFIFAVSGIRADDDDIVIHDFGHTTTIISETDVGRVIGLSAAVDTPRYQISDIRFPP